MEHFADSKFIYYFVLPIIAGFFQVWAKILSFRGAIGKQIRRTFDVGLETMASAVLMFSVLAMKIHGDWMEAVRAPRTVGPSESSTAQAAHELVLTLQVKGALPVILLMIVVLSVTAVLKREFGWVKKDDPKLLWGVLFPNLVGLVFLAVVATYFSAN